MEAIDIHWHVVPPTVVDALRRDGLSGSPHLELDQGGVERLMLHPPPGIAVEQRSGLLPAVYDERLILADLDRMKLDAAAISVSPTLFWYGAEPTLGAAVARLANDGIAAWVRAFPDRLLGLATLP